jgi:hypothetical protein
MTDSDYDLEIPEFQEITEEEGTRDKNLLADPSKGSEGILDDEDPERFVELEAEAAEEVVLAEDVGVVEGEEVLAS